MQKNNLDKVNLKRIQKLQNKNVSKTVHKYRVGNYVLLKGLTKTISGSKSNVSLKFKDIYKVTEILNTGFGLKLQNLRTGSVQSCSHEKIKLLSLEDLVAANITSKNFYNMPDLLSRRGYFKSGKSRLRLSLLEDESDCLEEELNNDCDEPVLGMAQATGIGANTESGLINTNITQPTNIQGQEPVLPVNDEQTAIDQEDALLELYSAADESLSEEMANSQGNTQGAANMDQSHSEVLEEVENKSDIDPETVNLGEIRGNTKYNLRVRPQRNKKYYKLELGPNYENNLRGGPNFEPNCPAVRREPDFEPNYPAKGILKKSPSTKKLTTSQKISVIETFPKSLKKSLREGFLLQRELKMPIANLMLAEFLYRNNFNSDKNILHHQSVSDSIKIYGRKHSKTQSKKVTFGPNCGATLRWIGTPRCLDKFNY